MLQSPITLSVAGTDIVLNRVNQDNYASVYYGKDGDDVYNLEVAHTVPSSKANGGESHLVKLSIEHYSPEGEYLRTSAAWTVIKTFNGPQNDVASANTTGALLSFLGEPGVLLQVIGRQS